MFNAEATLSRASQQPPADNAAAKQQPQTPSAVSTIINSFTKDLLGLSRDRAQAAGYSQPHNPNQPPAAQRHAPHAPMDAQGCKDISSKLHSFVEQHPTHPFSNSIVLQHRLAQLLDTFERFPNLHPAAFFQCNSPQTPYGWLLSPRHIHHFLEQLESLDPGMEAASPQESCRSHEGLGVHQELQLAQAGTPPPSQHGPPSAQQQPAPPGPGGTSSDPARQQTTLSVYDFLLQYPYLLQQSPAATWRLFRSASCQAASLIQDLRTHLGLGVSSCQLQNMSGVIFSGHFQPQQLQRALLLLRGLVGAQQAKEQLCCRPRLLFLVALWLDVCGLEPTRVALAYILGRRLDIRGGGPAWQGGGEPPLAERSWAAAAAWRGEDDLQSGEAPGSQDSCQQIGEEVGSEAGSQDVGRYLGKDWRSGMDSGFETIPGLDELLWCTDLPILRRRLLLRGHFQAYLQEIMGPVKESPQGPSLDELLAASNSCIQQGEEEVKHGDPMEVDGCSSARLGEVAYQKRLLQEEHLSDRMQENLNMPSAKVSMEEGTTDNSIRSSFAVQLCAAQLAYVVVAAYAFRNEGQQDIEAKFG